MRIYKLRFWWRNQVEEKKVQDIPHARAMLQNLIDTNHHISGAQIRYCDNTGINSGKWFLYMNLK